MKYNICKFKADCECDCKHKIKHKAGLWPSCTEHKHEDTHADQLCKGNHASCIELKISPMPVVARAIQRDRK